jgi:hypothetical protein
LARPVPRNRSLSAMGIRWRVSSLTVISTDKSHLADKFLLPTTVGSNPEITINGLVVCVVILTQNQ